MQHHPNGLQHQRDHHQQHHHDDHDHGRQESEQQAFQAGAPESRGIGHVVGEVQGVAQRLEAGGRGPKRHQDAEGHQAGVGRPPDLVDGGLERRGDVRRQQLEAERDRIVGRGTLAQEPGQRHEEDQEGEQREQAHVGDVAGDHPAIVLAEVVVGLPDDPADQPEHALGAPIVVPRACLLIHSPLPRMLGRTLPGTAQPRKAECRRRDHQSAANASW